MLCQPGQAACAQVLWGKVCRFRLLPELLLAKCAGASGHAATAPPALSGMGRPWEELDGAAWQRREPGAAAYRQSHVIWCGCPILLCQLCQLCTGTVHCACMRAA